MKHSSLRNKLITCQKKQMIHDLLSSKHIPLMSGNKTDDKNIFHYAQTKEVIKQKIPRSTVSFPNLFRWNCIEFFTAAMLNILVEFQEKLKCRNTKKYICVMSVLNFYYKGINDLYGSNRSGLYWRYFVRSWWQFWSFKVLKLIGTIRSLLFCLTGHK